MSAELHLPASLRASTPGPSVVELEAETVGGALDQLRLSWPQLERRIRDEQGRLRRHLRLYLGELDVADLQGLATSLPEGSRLYVIPQVSGG